MTGRRARAISVSVFIVSLVAIALSIPISLAARERIEPGQIVVIGDRHAPRTTQLLEEVRAEAAAGDPLETTTGQYNPAFTIVVVLLLCWILVGVTIVWRQPANWAGWLFIITGAPLPLLTLSQALVVYGAKADPGSVPFLGLWGLFGEFALYPIALLPLLFLLYPDGHPPSPRWRWAIVGLVGGTVAACLAFLVRPGPFNNWIEDGILFVNPLGVDALEGFSAVVLPIATVIALVSAVSTVVAVRQRFKRSSGEARQQMRWIAFVASLAGVFFVSMWIIGLGAELIGPDPEAGDDAPIFEILFGLTALTLVIGVPVAYLVAIFRYRLYDLDLVIKKTVRYVVLLGAFVLVGLLLVAAIPALVFGVGSGPDVVPVLVVAIALTAALTWIRPRAARLADRLVYGKRATPYEVLSEFSDRVGETYSTEDVLPRMAQLVAQATGAERVDVWIVSAGSMRAEASFPEGSSPSSRRVVDDVVAPVGDEHVAEVRHQGALLGAITLAPAADDPMNPAKEALVRDLAAQAGLVLRNVRLIDELRASRQRLVAAQDEERRKLERNIHDGVQQQLVALTVQLRLAEQMIERDAAKAREIVIGLQARSNEALEDLRDLARGIYPPLLADRGLAEALQAQARKAPISVVVEADRLGRYPQAVESALYFSCLEALNNVAKYADATRVVISLEQRDRSLHVTVHDDGRGFDAAATSYGTGLQGMADRIDAIGGTLAIDSAPGEGTTVSGTIPLTATA
jgi:signal transduction histidine kinase